MATVDLEQINKVYANGFHAVKDLNLDVRDGEFMVLVGPSGCGKTTALRMVAGLENISSGTLRIGGRPVNNVMPKDRDIAMVFQNYALYPHLTVRDNIGFALKLRKLPKSEIGTKVKETAEILGLTEWLDRKPGQLSGGQRQRVAMGRAIVREPAVFLMDEPLSNLDAKLRIAMRVEIRKLQRRLNTTSIYVTHDQLEAMTLADILVVMNAGQVEQVGNPLDIYQKPATTFVASFIGAPPMNLIGLRESGISLAAADAGILGVRPEDLELANGAAPAGGLTFELKVEAIEKVGAETYVYGLRSQQDGQPAISERPGELPPGEILVRIPGQRGPGIGETIRAVAPREKLHLFSADGRKRIAS